MAENTIKTRIQLKNDTETNWNKSVLEKDGGTKTGTGTSFIPKKGEAIFYLTDSTHPFSRLKVGDGSTNVVALPFVGPIATNNNPEDIGINTAIGTSLDYARADHSHKINLDTGDLNGQIKIAGTNINVKGLDTAAYAKVSTTSISDNDTSTDLPTKAQVVTYVENKIAGFAGAMHFKGVINSLPDATDATTYSNYEAGDVVLIDDKEYVYNKGLSAANSSWVLLGDESSYALKNETIEKTIFNSAGQLIYASAANTPEVLSIPNILANKTYVLKINNNLPNWEEEYSYTLPIATDTILGGIKIGYTNSISTEKKYAIQLTNDGKAYVEVNWTDTLYGVARDGGLTITDTPDSQTGKYLLAHSNTLSAGTSSAGIINSSETTLSFGDSFYIPQISYDIHGHITSITNTTLTLPNTNDEKVKQTPTSSETQIQWRRLLLGYSNVSNLEVTMNEETNQACFYQSLAADAKTGTLRANRYRVLDNVEVEWNSTDESLDFVFI